MRIRASFLASGLGVAAAAILFACVGDESSTIITPDAGEDTGAGMTDGATSGDASSPIADAGGGGNGDADAALGPITISGRTADLGYGYLIFAPAVDLVIIDATGKKTSATSDANGAFTAADILPPYDVLLTYGGGNQYVFYDQLTTATPVLPQSYVAVSGAEEEDHVTYGGTTPDSTATGYNVVLTMVPKGLTRATINTNDVPYAPDGGVFGGTGLIEVARLPTATTATFDLYFLSWQAAGDGSPLGMQAFGSLAGVTVDLTASTAISRVPVIDLHNVLSSTAFSKFVPPGTMTPVGRELWMSSGPRVNISVYSDISAKTDLNFATPTVTGYKIALCGSAYLPAAISPAGSHGCKGGLTTSASNLTLNLLDPATFVAPTEALTGVSRTGPFTITHTATKQRYLYTLRPVTGGGTQVFFYTTKKSITLPKGITLDGNAAYTLSVQSLGPFDSIDEALTEDELFYPHDRDHYDTVTHPVSFTTGL